MAFVFKRDISLSIGESDNAFILKLKKPRVSQLTRLYGKFAKIDREGDSALLSTELMQELKNIILTAAFGWEDVLDEDQKPMPFSIEALEDLIESDMQIFTAAINKIMAAVGQSLSAVKDSEKN
jgi:hypothetical protein